MGRPTTYRGMTTSWNSDGTLANMGGKYSYIRRNFDGMIYERREGTHPYPVNNTITDGNKILVDNGLTFIYILDKLVGFVYNENRYYYQRNILGDITHIYSEDGVLVAKYVYDGYGRHKVLNSLNEEDTNLYSIGNLNPFRYRGYYYDRVLGLYNLVSRYYDPQVCRFISPDTISILDKTKLDINGLNLYMYCNDNPIMFVDPSGHSALSAFVVALLIGTVIGSGIGAGVAGITAYAEGERGWDLVFDIIGGGIFGAAVGATAVLGGAAGLASIGVTISGFTLTASVALGYSVLATSVGGVVKYGFDYIFSPNADQFSVQQLIFSGINGGIQGVSTFLIAYTAGKNGVFNSTFKIDFIDFYSKAGVTIGNLLVGIINSNIGLF